MPTFKIQGATEIQAALKALEPRVAKKVIRQSVRKGLAPILAAAKANAPVGATKRTKKAIKLRAAVKRKRNVIALEIRIGDRDFVGKTFYGAFKEYGTKKMKGDHFMERAYDQQRGPALALVQTLIRQGIEREAKS